MRGAPDQSLDRRPAGSVDVKVVTYGGGGAFEEAMREDWENCELRSFLVVY